MNTESFRIDLNRAVRRWPRVEMQQNSTLRYTPPKDFPAFWLREMGFRPKLMRAWVTLDEIWDDETDTYDWNYRIGVDKKGEKRYYPYDWPKTRPSETHFEDYLTGFCSMADEVMLNIRRFERETADGILSMERYEEVVERVIEHCVDLCGNIRWIEALNESECRTFGRIPVSHRAALYDGICRAVSRLNARRGWDLKVGGIATTNESMPDDWREYLERLAAPGCPERRIDFYSWHSYVADDCGLRQMYLLHKASIAELGLPDAPVFLDEFGARGVSGEKIESLMNAGMTLTGMLSLSDLPGLYVFPWCTFHNPVLQMVYTQYLRTEGGYTPTPNAFAVQLLHMMPETELFIEQGEDAPPLYSRQPGTLRAARSGEKALIIASNPKDAPLTVEGTVCGAEGFSEALIEVLQVDEAHNYFPDDPADTQLYVTASEHAAVRDGAFRVKITLGRWGFAGIRITLK